MTDERMGVTDEQLSVLKNAKDALRAAEKAINDTILAYVGLKKGDTVRHKYNGLVYEIDYGYAYVDDGLRPRISVAARRKYQSGRKAGRTAATSSHLNYSDLEKTNGN